MKLRGCVLITVLVFLGYGFSCSGSGGDAAPTFPENLLNALSGAIASGDEAKAETLFTKDCWSAERDSGKRFFKQAVSRKFDTQKNDVRVKEEKAVVTADIIREGKVVDQVFFYCVKETDIWKFDGMDENKAHINHYLDGRLPARFFPADYPGNPELEELGKKLIEIAAPLKEAISDTEKQAELLKGVLAGDPGKIHSQLRLLLEVAHLKLNVVSTHMVDTIQRGAIVIHDDAGKEKVFLYLSKEADGWKLLNCYTGWLSAESILR